jgi:hypothetical protein
VSAAAAAARFRGSFDVLGALILAGSCMATLSLVCPCGFVFGDGIVADVGGGASRISMSLSDADSSDSEPRPCIAAAARLRRDCASAGGE